MDNVCSVDLSKEESKTLEEDMVQKELALCDMRDRCHVANARQNLTEVREASACSPKWNKL